ncbi:MAG: rRNA (uracil1498-N3)-methyltransferase [Acidimicrobiaceae bacterium]
MEPSGKAHVFVTDLDTLELTDDDHHHLSRVLRLRTGDELTASDGGGRWRRCRFDAPLDPIGEIQRDAPPQPEITIAFALVKGERPEWVVQKLTEVGVDRIIPFTAERSVVHWDADKALRNHTRLLVVAREAAMQSRRAWLPTVEPIATFDDVARRPGAALAERGGGPPTLAHPVVLIGPEGGWSERERGAGLAALGLGPTVLRAETAAIVAGAALSGLRSARSESVDGHGG